MKWFDFQMGLSHWEVHLVASDDGVFGECSFLDKRININKRLLTDPDELFATFLHELIHAAEYSLGYEWDESLVRSLEFALAPVLQRFTTLPAVVNPQDKPVQ